LGSATAAKAAVIAGWNFDTLVDNGTLIYDPVAADVADAAVTVGDLTRGAGLDSFLVRTYSAQPVLRFRNGVGANTHAMAIANNVYAEFSLVPLAGHELNLTTLTLDAWSAHGSTQARTFFVLSSTDNFASFTELIPDTVAQTGSFPPTSATGNINLTGLTSPIQFRIYGFNYANPGNLNGTASADRGLQYDNIVVNGTVTAVPEPDSALLPLGLGIAGLLIRKRLTSRA